MLGFYKLTYVALIILSSIAAFYHDVAWTVFGCFGAWIAKSEVEKQEVLESIFADEDMDEDEW